MIDRRRLLRAAGRMAAPIALAALAAACASNQDKVDAIKAVNKEFCGQYESIIAERGTRIVHVPRQDAYTAMRAALAGIGMKLDDQNSKLGLFSVYAPAPLPLDAEEWQKVSEADLPLLHRIAEPHIGWLTTLFLHFEPGGLEVVVTATVIEVPEGSSVSLTARLREVKAPASGFPRRECLSPNALRAGLDKIWAAFDHELLGARSKS